MAEVHSAESELLPTDGAVPAAPPLQPGEPEPGGGRRSPGGAVRQVPEMGPSRHDREEMGGRGVGKGAHLSSLRLPWDRFFR